jgi:hypothetical protein
MFVKSPGLANASKSGITISNSFLINYILFIIDSMKEDWNVLCICCFETCDEPVSILKCKCSIHKCIIDSKSIDRMVWAWYLQNNYEAAEVHLY